MNINETPIQILENHVDAHSSSQSRVEEQGFGDEVNDKQTLADIRTTPGLTDNGKPFDHIVKDKVDNGGYRLELIPAKPLGTARPIEVYRATRARGTMIKPWSYEIDDDSYCPSHWADIAIGRGACGYRCRACFLILTHRGFCDPSRHVLYENVDYYEHAVRNELQQPGPNLGLGIDCSDSLLYEGVTGHARRLIPLFADQKTDPFARKLILLTKSTNVHYLEGLPTNNILMTFSLNPEPIADLWEGKWNDGIRITPHIEDRLKASAKAQQMEFEVRWRIDPILPVESWADIYRDFFISAAAAGHRPTRITLGTYREMGRSLLTIAAKWGLPSMQWTPPKLSKDGMHYHIEEAERVAIYRQLSSSIYDAWGKTVVIPIVALCKESKVVRAAVGITHSHCNCE
jgi:DNA repair photolyase